MADYVRKSNKFLLRGMNLTLPGDRLSPEWAQLMTNIRCYRAGEWRQRPGSNLVASTAASPLLWGKRLNNIPAGTHKIFVGNLAGNIYDDSATLLDSGYSANGYSGFIARPDASPSPYLFLGNSDRHSKFDSTGARTDWGLHAPVTEPLAELELPTYGIADRANTTVGWTPSGGSLSAPTRASSTITNIIYDRGTDRWACVQPASMDSNWREGMLLEMATNPETVIVERVFPAISATTIASIAYDVGTTGLCCVQLAIPTLGLERDMMLLLNTEPVRVLSVEEGLDGVPSFRCSTTVTHAAAETVTGVRSFRAAFALTHAAGESMSASYLGFSISGAGLATVSRTGTYNLSRTTATYQRPMQPDDYIHISLQTSDWASITEIQLQFDCDASINDYAHNYYFKSIRPPDLLEAVQQTAPATTAQQQAIQRQQIDDLTRQQLESERQQLMDYMGSNGGSGSMFGYALDDIRNQRIAQIDTELAGFTVQSGVGPISHEGVTGVNQWTELRIPIQEFQRVGADSSRGWQNIAGLRITVQAAAAVDVGINAIWFGGTFGPDWAPGQVTAPESYTTGLNYIYRLRNTATGSTSAWSPPMRSTIFPHRQGVLIRGEPNYTDPQGNVIDYARIGGTLGAYHVVGTAPADDPTFLDTIDDSQASRNEQAVFDHYRPWVTTDRPKSGTCNVVGSTVTLLTGTVETDYIRLNTIEIGGQIATLYTCPQSSTRLYLNESLGTLTNVEWRLASPTREGQPLPSVFGPYSTSSGEFYFGLGDPVDPGILYYTLGNDPEGQSDAGYVELSTPSEPLMGGTVLDGRIFVWSDRRCWIILPNFEGGQSGAGGLFYPQETSIGKGLAGPWACCGGDMLYWVSPDGVFSSPGQTPTSLTDESLSPLFRHDGGTVQGQPINGLYPFDLTETGQPYLSLTYSKDGLYLTGKIAGSSEYQSLFYSFLTRGWMSDVMTEDRPIRWLREEGDGVDALLCLTRNGKILELDPEVVTDNAASMNCRLLTRAEDWDDWRSQHQVGDIVVDADVDGQTVNLSGIVDNGLSTVTLTSLTGTGRTLYTRDINDGVGVLARTFALDISWQAASGFTYLYGWEPAALLKAEASDARATDWSNGGYSGNKWVQGVRLVIDTYGQNKTIEIEQDGGTLISPTSTFVVNTTGETTVVLSWDPFISHQMRILGDDTPWRLLQPPEWIYEPEPEAASWWETQFTNLDLPGYLHIHDVMIPYRSTNDATLYVSWDGAPEQSYPLPNSGGEPTKLYFQLQAKKGKLVSFRVLSTIPMAIYMMDLEIRAKAWGIPGNSYQIFRPFGDISRQNGGARV